MRSIRNEILICEIPKAGETGCFLVQNFYYKLIRIYDANKNGNEFPGPQDLGLYFWVHLQRGPQKETAGDDTQPRYLSTNIIAIRNV